MMPDVEAALSEYSKYYTFSHYITESERVFLNENYAGLYKEMTAFVSKKEAEASPDWVSIRRFYDAFSDSKNNKKINNERFVENQLKGQSQYFDSVLDYPLDQQQREAVVSLEDNVLVISSAGSGKTMTTVGKVRYLIDVQGVDPAKILLITFTRKAAESLSNRLEEEKLKCRTFHKLALDIISEVTGEKPSITDQDFSIQVYHKLMAESDAFHEAIASYIVSSRYTMKDQFEYDSRMEYMKDRKKYGVKAYYRDMDGHTVFCKSDEESHICDFLGSKGISFRYEERYEINTADFDHRQYYPDFSIYIDGPNGKTKRLYLEHFAVNEYDRCPPFFTPQEELDYKQGIHWKRQLHQLNGTVLLETSSANFHRGDIYKVLTQMLLAHGAVFKTVTNENLSRDLARQEESILNTLTAFNFLLKSRDTGINTIRSQARMTPDLATIDDIMIPFIMEYKKMEDEKQQIDFTDAIIYATELCKNGYSPDYDYILVDEFQDISQDRYRFLQSLRRKWPLTKLFCVGDDWQSIYRFAGSDMALFKKFEDYFGYTKKCLMETTYRFGEPAIDQSSKFILANPEQSAKSVKPFNDEAETKLDFIPVKDKADIVDTVKHLADSTPDGKEIMLLGRYNFDVGVFKDTELAIHETHTGTYVSYGKRKMRFMTVHQSKGLECDYIILLNCNSGTLGFPADIADSPVLKYVLSEPDEYAFGEERRVFYVGITRAKKHTWALYDANKPSPFISEFVELKNPEKTEESIPESELCPKCHCGRVKVVKSGIASNRNPYSVLVCSNREFGCDYQETIFVNLNGYRAPRKKTGFK